MAVRVRSRTAAAASTASVTFTPTWDQSGLPAGHGTDVGVATPQPGDMILAFDRVRVGSTPVLTPPAAFAWTTDSPAAGWGGAVKQFLFHHFVAAGDDFTASETWGASAGSAHVVTLVCLAGVNPSTPFVSAPAAGNGQGATNAGPIVSPSGIVTEDTALHLHAAFMSTSSSGAHTGSWDAGTTLAVTGSGTTWASTLMDVPTAGQTTATGRTLTISPSDATAWNAVVIPVKADAPTSPPVNTSAPAVTTDGTPQPGETITCSTGAWINSPSGYTYQWQRDGANISGATSSSYLLTAADAGHAVRCVVTATNAVGSASANSNAVTPTATSVDRWRPVRTYRFVSGQWT